MGRAIDEEVKTQEGFSRASAAADQGGPVPGQAALRHFVQAFDSGRTLVQLIALYRSWIFDRVRHGKWSLCLLI